MCPAHCQPTHLQPSRAPLPTSPARLPTCRGPGTRAQSDQASVQRLLPGQASWNRQCDVRTATLALWPALDPFPSLQSLPPADPQEFSARPAGAGTLWARLRGCAGAAPLLQSGLLSPAARSCRLTKEDAQSFAEPAARPPADSASPELLAEAKTKALIFPGRPCILHCREEEKARPVFLLLLATKRPLLIHQMYRRHQPPRAASVPASNSRGASTAVGVTLHSRPPRGGPLPAA